MKKQLALVLALVMVFGLTGCGAPNYPDLPDDPLVLTTFETADAEGFSCIAYNGRIYAPYGTIDSRYPKASEVDACIGYVVQDTADGVETSDASDTARMYTLIDDPAHNYLMFYDTETTLMNQPAFWRCIDTRGQEIETPAYVKSLEYDYWKT
jgi:hypothetical protein